MTRCQKIVGAVGLLALIVVGMLYLTRPQPPARIGMSRVEVRAKLGRGYGAFDYPILTTFGKGRVFGNGWDVWHADEPDFWDNWDRIEVYYLDDVVVGWDVEPIE